VNLEIALRLDDVMHLLGYKTVMIRTTDRSIYTSGTTIAAQKVSDLRERVRIVNETNGGVLISIHQNTFFDSQYGGAQVFYAGNEDSKELASALQKKWITTLNPDSHRSAKKGEGIYLLQNISKPGILVECGFLSNPKEEALLRSDDYQKKMCCVIAAAVSGFLTDCS
jgi:N-acetylmuramoyl-L-alanine amidase